MDKFEMIKQFCVEQLRAEQSCDIRVFDDITAGHVDTFERVLDEIKHIGDNY